MASSRNQKIEGLAKKLNLTYKEKVELDNKYWRFIKPILCPEFIKPLWKPTISNYCSGKFNKISYIFFDFLFFDEGRHEGSVIEINGQVYCFRGLISIDKLEQYIISENKEIVKSDYTKNSTIYKTKFILIMLLCAIVFILFIFVIK